MKINLENIKPHFKDYLIYVFLLAVLIYVGYVAYFFYDNLYLTVTEKVPMEQIIVKEKINLTLYEQVVAELENKQQYKLNFIELKDPFKLY